MLRADFTLHRRLDESKGDGGNICNSSERGYVFMFYTALKCACNSLGADFPGFTGAVLQDPLEKVAFSVLFF